LKFHTFLTSPDLTKARRGFWISRRARRVECTQVEDYWHYSRAGRVQRFRVLMVRTLENARQLPGFRNALAAYRNRMHEYDERIQPRLPDRGLLSSGQRETPVLPTACDRQHETC